MSMSGQIRGQRTESLEEAFYSMLGKPKRKRRGKVLKKSQRSRVVAKSPKLGTCDRGDVNSGTYFEAACQQNGLLFEPSTDTPSEATCAAPGSSEKIAAMVWRIEHGEPLWHPDDPICEHTMIREDHSILSRDKAVGPLFVRGFIQCE